MTFSYQAPDGTMVTVGGESGTYRVPFVPPVGEQDVSRPIARQVGRMKLTADEDAPRVRKGDKIRFDGGPSGFAGVYVVKRAGKPKGPARAITLTVEKEPD